MDDGTKINGQLNDALEMAFNGKSREEISSGLIASGTDAESVPGLVGRAVGIHRTSLEILDAVVEGMVSGRGGAAALVAEEASGRKSRVGESDAQLLADRSRGLFREFTVRAIGRKSPDEPCFLAELHGIEKQKAMEMEIGVTSILNTIVMDWLASGGRPDDMVKRLETEFLVPPGPAAEFIEGDREFLGKMAGGSPVAYYMVGPGIGGILIGLVLAAVNGSFAGEPLVFILVSAGLAAAGIVWMKASEQ